jgi:DNA invertase Pin-like site-specific DNA recombinase
MRCIIYTRFSPRRNASESESCEVQAAQCGRFAAERGWEIGGVFEDRDASGKDSERPGLARAIAALGEGDVLLVYKRDRLARDVLIAELTRRRVKAAGANIVAVSGDIDGDDDDPTVVFVRQIMDAVAELERKQIAERTHDTMCQHQRNGKRMGRYAPYGWKIDPGDSSKLVPEPREQEAVDHIKELAEEGRNPHAIMRAMNEDMPDIARTGKWNVKVIRKIIERN